jgi:hypothetical protein
MLFFGAVGTAIAIEAFPSRVVADATAIDFRLRFRRRRVAWSEIARVEEQRLSPEVSQLILHLTLEGAGKHDHVYLRVPPIAPTEQAELLAYTESRLEDVSRTVHAPLSPPKRSNSTRVVRHGDGLRVVASGEVDAALGELHAAAAAAVREHQYDPTFNGELELVVAAADTPALRAGLARLAATVQAEAVKLRLSSGASVSVSSRVEGDSSSVKAAVPVRAREEDDDTGTIVERDGTRAKAPVPVRAHAKNDDIVAFTDRWLDEQLEIIQDETGSPLIPLAIVYEAGPKVDPMHYHFVAPVYRDGVALALDHVASANGAWIVIWDGYLTHGGERTDALFAIARLKGQQRQEFARRYLRITPKRVTWASDVIMLDAS